MLRHLAACVAVIAAASFATAQTAPQLLTVFPPGAKAGETVEVTFTGNGFDGEEKLLFSEKGIKAELVPGSATTPKQPNPPPGMARATAVKFKVTVPGETRPGTLDVRLVCKRGLSNPRAFVVGDTTEANEAEPNNDVPQAQGVPLETTVNGVISNPTDVDYVSVRVKAGQNVVVYCLSTSIDSKLQADLMVAGPDGKRLAANRGYRGGDAVLDFLAPADGEYLIRVAQFAYVTGGTDHFYRLTVTTGPWVDAVFPPVAPVRKGVYTVHGRNLTGAKPAVGFARPDGRPFDALPFIPDTTARGAQLLTGRLVPPAAGMIDAVDLDVPGTATSRPLLLSPAAQPVFDNGDNDTPDKAQPTFPGMTQSVTAPADIVGRIEKKGDKDWYSFIVNKGSVWTIEVFAERIGSPIDAYFVLTDEKGKVIVEVDDGADTLSPNQFYTKSDDPARYRFVAPADGTYRVMVSSREAATQFGVRDQYVLRVAQPNPEFRLAVMPVAANFPDAGTLPKGGTVLFNVYVWRFDGFDDPIVLTAENLPRGVTCPPQTIGARQTRGVLVLTADPETAADWAGFVTIKGAMGQHSATARPFSVTWPVPGLNPNQPPQNVPMLTRMDRGPGLALAVRGEAPFRLTPAADEPIEVKAGAKVEVTLKVDRKDGFKDAVQLFSATPNFGPRQQGNNPPQPVGTVAGDKHEVKLSLDVQPNTPPGTYSLVLTGRSGAPQPKGGNRQAVPAPTYPALPVTVIVEGPAPKKK
jgi:hypothetical protein